MIQYTHMALAPGQLFDPATFSPEQAALLTSTPGQSLSASNDPATIAKAMSLSPNIPTSYINPTSPVSLPGGTTTNDYRSLLAGTNGSLPNGSTAGSGAPGTKSPEQLTLEQGQKDILSKMTELGGTEEFAASLKDSLGINQDNKDLKDLQAQLLAVNNEAAIGSLNVDRQGRPAVLTSAANLEKGNIERDRTIKALRLSSSIQAIQGNLSLANDQLDQTIKLKYEPLKNQIDVLNKQLEFNYQSFTASEKKKADALKLENDIKLKKIDAQQDLEKAWGTLKNTALANSAPMSIVNQAEAARAAGDENTARSLLAPYTGTRSNDVNGGGGGKSTFTTSQLNTGAAVSGLAIADFKALDDDTKNFFINNKTRFNAQKKEIQDAIALEEDTNALEDEIRNMDIPVIAQDQLIDYMQSLGGQSKSGGSDNLSLVSRGDFQEKKPWWKFW